jgi:hypothetical protein
VGSLGLLHIRWYPHRRRIGWPQSLAQFVRHPTVRRGFSWYAAACHSTMMDRMLAPRICRFAPPTMSKAIITLKRIPIKTVLPIGHTQVLPDLERAQRGKRKGHAGGSPTSIKRSPLPAPIPGSPRLVLRHLKQISRHLPCLDLLCLLASRAEGSHGALLSQRSTCAGVALKGGHGDEGLLLL